tara:strand:- start:51 stop:248 length:198 start_codon:yes stop_codon:yes gene_type:complete
MEYIAGPVVAMLISLGYTEFKMKKLKQEAIDNTAKLEVELSRKVMGALYPVSKSLKELQTFTGIR